MDNHEIARILEGMSQFGGVFPADEIYNLQKNKFYIVNADPSFMPGTHWLAMYMSDVPEFFDSLGKSPSFYHIEFEYALINRGPNYIYNARRVQNYGSDMCGMYCIYYVLKRSAEFSMRYIVNEFDSLDYNDNMVREYVRRLNCSGKAKLQCPGREKHKDYNLRQMSL